MRRTLITGGAGAGKSRYACDRAARCGPKVLVVATCVPCDEEMRAKVERHRAARPAAWHTVERDRDVAAAITPDYDAAVVDCLTLLVSQMLEEEAAESDILAEVADIFDAPPCPLFVVTNEVGWGIVPENPLARRFRDLAGRVNRLAAERADEVILMVAGIPVPVRGTHGRAEPNA